MIDDYKNIMNFLLFLSVPFGKYGIMIGLEALSMRFVQTCITHRQAKCCKQKQI